MDYTRHPSAMRPQVKMVLTVRRRRQIMAAAQFAIRALWHKVLDSLRWLHRSRNLPARCLRQRGPRSSRCRAFAIVPSSSPTVTCHKQPIAMSPCSRGLAIDVACRQHSPQADGQAPGHADDRFLWHARVVHESGEHDLGTIVLCHPSPGRLDQYGASVPAPAAKRLPLNFTCATLLMAVLLWLRQNFPVTILTNRDGLHTISLGGGGVKKRREPSGTPNRTKCVVAAVHDSGSWLASWRPATIFVPFVSFVVNSASCSPSPAPRFPPTFSTQTALRRI